MYKRFDLDLDALMQQQPTPCVSLYMPVYRLGTEMQQNPIRLRNLLSQAEDQLKAHDLRTPDIVEMLEPARAVITDTNFWYSNCDGLAVFLSPEHTSIHRLPRHFDERVVVGDRFYLKPLLPLLSGEGDFYVLALSQKAVRLFYGNQHSLSPVELKNVPQSLDEALRLDDPEKQTQWHSGVGEHIRRGKGQNVAMFHGHGGVRETIAKDNILRYFQQVNQGLQTVLRDKKSPLVLAAVDYLHPIYKKANTYAHLLERGITGNPEAMNTDDLRSRAWQVIAPRFTQAQTEAVQRYPAVKPNRLASSVIKEVVAAAYSGRVDVLFVALGHQRWGTFDPESFAVTVHETPEPGDEMLLDFAAMHTLRNDGTVYALDPQEMPDNAPVAAIFRYALTPA